LQRQESAGSRQRPKVRFGPENGPKRYGKDAPTTDIAVPAEASQPSAKAVARQMLKSTVSYQLLERLAADCGSTLRTLLDRCGLTF
jgi:hypothetical protein